MSHSRKSTPRSSVSPNVDKNLSNSNAAGSRRISDGQKENRVPDQKSTAYRILGQDREMTEAELFEAKSPASDRYTPTSSRSSFGSRPVSNMSKRTPTPSKQISLQAVRRKEETDEPLEPIDWNDFNRAISQNETRIPSPPPESDSDSDDIPSPRQTPMSAEARQALVEQRAKDLTSALSTCRIDDQDVGLSKRLDEIEIEREKQREKMEEEEKARINNNDSIINHNDVGRNVFSYGGKQNNDNVDKTLIGVKEADDILVVKRKGENVIGKHAMDKVKDTAISSGSKNKEKSTDSESGKKDEASANTEESSSDYDSDEEDRIGEKGKTPKCGKKDEASANTEESSSDDDSDEEDLIGEKGKAPNALLMEFVTCLMEKDYENAEKLCKMILIYEPDNPEALSFLPVIQEKRQQDAAEPDLSEGSGAESGEETESDDSGEDEEGSDDDEDDDDSSDEDSDEDQDDDDDDDDDTAHPDSGIASANSD